MELTKEFMTYICTSDQAICTIDSGSIQFNSILCASIPPTSIHQQYASTSTCVRVVKFPPVNPPRPPFPAWSRRKVALQSIQTTTSPFLRIHFTMLHG